MADMCKPRWKIALFIFIYLFLFTKGKAKSRLSFQNGFSSLSSVVILDAAREQFAGENIVCAAATDSRGARGKALTKARIQNFPNSTATYSLRLLLLSGNVELNPGDNASRTEQTNTKTKQTSRSNVTIAHLNIRSLKNRDHYIFGQDLAIKHKLDIFTISETWLHNSVSDLKVQSPGYSLFRLDRSGRKGGGVCAFVNSNFKCFQLKELSYITEFGFHQLWLKVQVGNFRSFLLCTAYRPPNTPPSCFESEFSDALTSAMSRNIPLFIVGDLNCNLLNINDTGSKTLLNLCNTSRQTRHL